MTSSFPKGGSEFGGYPGRVQPKPHDVKTSASEQLQAVYATDESDDSFGVEEVVDGWLKDGQKRLAK